MCNKTEAPIYDFNPRSLTGATWAYQQQNAHQFISIHAPSRERQLIMSSTTIVLIFQSTLPHGSDRWYSILNISHLLFQSTLPHGSDAGHGVTLYYSGISIHAPSRERLRDVREVIHYTQFQSTLPHGSDPLHDIDTVVRGISIHAPSRERAAFTC